MPILVNAHELSHSFAARPLFSGLTFGIETGDRIGLIGPNGAGKSTLLKILASQISPDEGQISLQRGLRVSFLEQVPQFAPSATLWSTVMEGIADPEDWEGMGLAHETISRLSLDRFEMETPIEKFSGGWQKRIALARELVKRPDLLLLDEPTNHLDIDTILWLETFLAQSRFATLTVTHDRLFLQKVSNRILEIDRRHEGGLLSVRGDYSAYLQARQQLISGQERREIVLRNTLRRETEWLRQGAKARTTKQQARIQRAGELKEEVEDLSYRNQNRVARIDFQAADKNPKKLLAAENVSKEYEGKTLFRNLSVRMTPGTRLGLLGANGSGKSTLIRVLLGQEKPSTGEVTHSDQLEVAYFDQRRDVLDPEVTVAKTLTPGDTVEFRGGRTHIRSYLDRFLFTQMQMDMKVGRLSGGEQARLLIARLMLTQANLLVLDEPTNDLDIATLGVLEECLEDFPGAVILVTHDRYFLDRVSNQILAFPPEPSNGELVSFSDLAQWEAWMQGRTSKAGAPSPMVRSSSALVVATAAPAVEKKKRKLGFKEQRELDGMEAALHIAEAKQTEFTHQLSLPENQTNAVFLNELTQALAQVEQEIDRLYKRWAELEE